MSEQELKAAVKAAVSEAMAERDSSCRRCCDTCDLEPGEHRDHHQALRGAFSVRRQVINVMVTAIAGGTLLWLGLAVWEAFKAKVKG